MFTAHCPECDKRQLILPSQVKQLINDEQGIVAIFTCWCGERGAERLRTVAAKTPKPEFTLTS